MPILFVLFVAVVVLADMLIRYAAKKHQEKRVLKARAEALEVSLNLDFTREAKTLKRVEIENPKARILCVDDEEVILSGFRRILALDGYSVDTVETGQEALGLLQSNNYDFVFMDLKMPAMDGVDATRSIKHLRPDIDVIIITGFASVETAVECMKCGAMDYAQKPFSEDELLDFVNKIVIRREDRIQKELIPKVNITHLSNLESMNRAEFEIPGGVFISPGHCWASIKPSGNATVGMDDFAKKILGRIDQIEFPNVGRSIQKGQVLFIVKQGLRKISFLSPLSGRIESNNEALADDLTALDITTYNKNWVCNIATDCLDSEIPEMKIGKGAVDFFLSHIESYGEMLKKVSSKDGKGYGRSDRIYIGGLEEVDDQTWHKIESEYFGGKP